ncbi:MAG TPA: hypothetical protein VNT60_01305, partial [Deinococcales bacterium]|nr:hypothetical protein [Deinococcales bacterium]
GPDWSWAEREGERLAESLRLFERGRQIQREAAALERDLRVALERPLDARAVHGPELLGAVDAYHAGLTTLMGEGPGNAHRARRLAEVATALVEEEDETAAAVVPLDDLPALAAVSGHRLPSLDGFAPGEASRARAIVDRAYALDEGDDLDALVMNLLALDGPPDSALGRIALEARFAASGVYLSVGDLESARDLLEAVSQGQFERPAYLPGYVLVRLGQVRDLQGERALATRAYGAALALEWLPAAAREVAESGLRAPFQLAG